VILAGTARHMFDSLQTLTLPEFSSLFYLIA